MYDNFSRNKLMYNIKVYHIQICVYSFIQAYVQLKHSLYFISIYLIAILLMVKTKVCMMMAVTLLS